MTKGQRETAKLGYQIAVGLLLVVALPSKAANAAADWEQAIAALQAVGPEGQGNERAGSALRELEQASSAVLLPLLEAMDDTDGLGLNWLRGAADVIVDRELSAERALPLSQLGEFLLDVRHHPRARRFAFELIQRLSPGAAEALLPGMLNDPSVELRRDAVQRLLESAAEVEAAGGQAAAGLIFQQALGAARDVDQIDTIAEALGRGGKEVDLAKHFGFVMNWKVIGPFENPDRRGFDMVFSPEKDLNLAGSHQGKEGEVRWQELATTDRYGMLDINQAFGPLKEVTAYAYSEFESPEALPVDIRLGCKNAYKLWLNGEYLFGMNEYHRGMRIDQYTVKAKLRAGKNVILMKVCQNEQVERWTVEWQFQLRVCDATGTAILAANRPASSVSDTAR